MYLKELDWLKCVARKENLHELVAQEKMERTKCPIVGKRYRKITHEMKTCSVVSNNCETQTCIVVYDVIENNKKREEVSWQDILILPPEEQPQEANPEDSKVGNTKKHRRRGSWERLPPAPPNPRDREPKSSPVPTARSTSALGYEMGLLELRPAVIPPLMEEGRPGLGESPEPRDSDESETDTSETGEEEDFRKYKGYVYPRQGDQDVRFHCVMLDRAVIGTDTGCYVRWHRESLERCKIWAHPKGQCIRYVTLKLLKDGTLARIWKSRKKIEMETIKMSGEMNQTASFSNDWDAFVASMPMDAVCISLFRFGYEDPSVLRALRQNSVSEALKYDPKQTPGAYKSTDILVVWAPMKGGDAVSLGKDRMNLLHKEVLNPLGGLFHRVLHLGDHMSKEELSYKVIMRTVQYSDPNAQGSTDYTPQPPPKVMRRSGVKGLKARQAPTGPVHHLAPGFTSVRDGTEHDVVPPEGEEKLTTRRGSNKSRGRVATKR